MLWRGWARFPIARIETTEQCDQFIWPLEDKGLKLHAPAAPMTPIRETLQLW